MSRVLIFLRLIRLDQWVKNGFLFLPIFFDQSLFQTQQLANTIIGFFAFSLASSSIYVLNDYRDKGVDKAHPIKKNRPQASGEIGTITALVTTLVCLFAAAALTFQMQSISFGAILLLYILLNVSYSLGLKRVALLDIFLPASGYVLRVYAGGVVSGIQPSAWLTLMSLLLALFLIIAKRQDDLMISTTAGNQTRRSLSGTIKCFSIFHCPWLGPLWLLPIACTPSVQKHRQGLAAHIYTLRLSM